MKPSVLVIRAAGTNCELETAYAFELAGAEPNIIHINALRENPQLLRDNQFLAIPGGFSYGDDIASGRVFANELTSALGDELNEFVDKGGYAIGICNGFQTLVKSGLLPRVGGSHEQSVTLTDNTSGRYTDRWVKLAGDPTRCAWIPDDEEIELPVAHAEGRFRAPEALRQQLAADHQVALRYTDDNFNGSDDAIAGICDPTGRVLVSCHIQSASCVGKITQPGRAYRAAAKATVFVYSVLPFGMPRRANSL